jgi:hypothetical protein
MKNSTPLVALAVALLIGVATPARAVDGCKVLLCLAGPWQSIAACVSEVEQLFQDLWDGDPFPSCSLASGTPYIPNIPNARMRGAGAANVWLAQRALAPDPNCPPQYVTALEWFGRPTYGCRYAGMIAVRMNGELWSKTYWNMAGGSVTELSAYAQSFGRVPGMRWPADSRSYQTAQAGDPGG